MSGDSAFANINELLAGIRQGMVPHAVRLFAAQGLLPVSREELIRILALLTVDGDPEISETARTTLGTFSIENYLSVLEVADLDPLEIDLLSRTCSDDRFLDAVVRHPQAANETLRWLAHEGSASVQLTIVTNQKRLLGCLELLSDVRANPNTNQDVLRRVREFEEEFIEKATVWATAEQLQPEIETGPSIEDALNALKLLGMQVSLGFEGEPGLPEPDAGAPPDVRDAYIRIALMNVFEKIMCALKGTREERLILVRDRNNLVLRACVNSPRMNELDIEQIAAMRGVTDEVFRMIVTKPRWLRRYGIIRNLAFNPKTPPGVALQLLRRLNLRDLANLARDRNISEVVRKVARRDFENRR